MQDNTWDTLYASKLDLAHGSGTGRVLVYDPAMDETAVLVHGIKFSNGITVDKDEMYILFAETFGVNLLKYNLQGEKAGIVEVVIHSKDLPGYLDGVNCSWKTGKCYSVMPSSIVPIHKLWN